MAETFAVKIAREQAKLKRQALSATAAPRLQNASLDDTDLPVYDRDGQLKGSFGKQQDGSFGGLVRNSPAQPTPTKLSLSAGELGAVECTWDGGTTDFDKPLVHGHLVVESCYAGEDGETPGDWHKASTIRDRDGGATTIVCPTPGVWMVRGYLVGQDRVTRGEASEVETVRVEALVDTEAIEQELEDARDRITEADERLTAGQQALTGNLDNINNVRLPALRDRLDTIEPVIEDYDTRIIAAQDGAQSARDTAENLRDNVLPPLSADLSDLTENRLPAVEGTLDTTRLGMENLRDIRVPELEDTLASGLAGLADDAETTRHLFVGNTSNMWPEAWHGEDAHGVYTYNPGGAFANSYERSQFRDENVTASPVWSPTVHSHNRRGWQVDSTAGAGALAFRVGAGVGIPVTTGEKYALQCWVRDLGDGGVLRWHINFLSKDGQQGTNSFSAVILDLAGLEHEADDDEGITHTFEVPDLGYPDGMYMVPYLRHEPAQSGWSRTVMEPKLRKMVDGKLVVDGSISARHIMAESIAGAVAEFLHITAEQIDTEGLAAYLATIVQLDAEQITSGKISTARLDAEEVAGAVANFLTLDALEINVEQLAGEIANIIEVTAESIASGSISTRHMAIADTENLFPQQAVEDLAANGDNTAPWRRVRGNTNRWQTVTGQGRGMRAIRINDGTASNVRTTLEYAPGSSFGIQMSPGDSFRLTFYGWAGGSGAAPTISLLTRNAEGSFVGRPATATAVSGWREYELEVHNTDSEVRFLRVEFDVPAGVAMRGHWQDFKLRHMTNGELLVDGAVKARTLDAEDVFSDTAVINKVWADIVRSRLVQSEGIITEDMIATGAITTPKLTVTEEMVARFAQILHLVADRVEMNSFIAMSGMVGHLEAIGLTLSDEAAGRRTEVSGQGLTITDSANGEVLTQLGTFTDSLFTIMGEEGTPAVTMTQGGGVSAVQLSSQGDPTFGGKPLAGAHFDSARWHVTDNVVDLTSQGVTHFWEEVFEGETYAGGVSQTGIGVTHLEAVLRPNRLYRIKCSHFEMGDRTNYWMQALTTTSDDLSVRPVRPSFLNDGVIREPRVHGGVPPSTSGGYNTTLSYEIFKTYTRPTRFRVTFLVGNSSSVGNVFGSLSRCRPVFSIEDVGPSTGPKGYGMRAHGNLTAESIPELPEDLSQSYPQIQTATYTLNLDTRMATRQYMNGTPRFGRWSNGLWYMTVAQFADWSGQPGIRQYGQFHVSVRSWLRPTHGNIFQSAVPTFTGLPASFNFDTQLLNMPDQLNVARYSPRQVGPSGSAVDVLLAKSQANIAIGRTGWGATDIGYPASGVIDSGTNARLSTELGGGTE